ncbi:hypothetical protein BJX63DRAFT_438599 [Aspergillus granulosus]|uniref:FAD-binding domain-containing protein n=1 Tax=Aspergillus granulosus TaxID=176169 RepID=A0ABR4GRH0_9EURO
MNPEGMNLGASLDIAVVGGGIAGLAAALYLQQSGHRITIFERSPLFKEAGFAVSIAPNGTKVLTALEFDYERAKAVDCHKIDVNCGITLKPIVDIPLKDHLKRWGDRWVVLYRPDLHKELVRLASTEAASDPQITMRLGARVVKTEINTGTLFFEDGTSFTADLIVGADGENSVVKEDKGWSMNPNASKLLKSPIRVCRSVTPTEMFMRDELLGPFIQSRKHHLSAFTDGNRVLTWWACGDGQLQDLEAGYPVAQRHEHGPEESRRILLDQYKGFHPTIKRALGIVESSSDWDINFTSTPLCWTAGKAVLIGDAVHSMFPTTGQGACQCLEDAAALGILLSRLASSSDLSRRLELFQELRSNRVVEIHALSSVLLGREAQLGEHIRGVLPEGRVLGGPLDHLDITNG